MPMLDFFLASLYIGKLSLHKKKKKKNCDSITNVKIHTSELPNSCDEVGVIAILVIPHKSTDTNKHQL